MWDGPSTRVWPALKVEQNHRGVNGNASTLRLRGFENFISQWALGFPDRLAQEMLVGLRTRRLPDFKVDIVPGNSMELQPTKR